MFSAPIEFEGKILDINPSEAAQKITELGGQKLGEKTLRRYVYDIHPQDQSQWVRLRDNGDEVTLTVKQISTAAIDGTHETEVQVSDFETTNTLLGLLGFSPKAYQENHRVSFSYEKARLEIDSWPRIPAYLEIEAASTSEVQRIAALLGYSAADLTGENTTSIYARYGIDLTQINDLRF